MANGTKMTAKWTSKCHLATDRCKHQRPVA